MSTASFFQALAQSPIPPDRPLVIQTWAQTLDGSVAWPDGTPLLISNPESMRFTHQLRAFCDGILVGIGAVLTDDPQLTARYGAQRQPQPLILDTHLRLPPHARVLQHRRPPWVLTGPQPHPRRAQALREQGAHIVPLPLTAEGRVDLAAGLRFLRTRGIRTLMVEGGPTVHTAFLRAGFSDWLAMTLSPRLLGGLPALRPLVPSLHASLPVLDPRHWADLGTDLLLWGTPRL